MSKTFKFLITLLIIVLFLLPQNQCYGYDTISYKDAFKIISEKNSNYIIIDVRTPEEFNTGHLEGAINIPIQILSEEKYITSICKDKYLIVYCKSGIRSKKACNILDSYGFSKVYYLGGIDNFKTLHLKG